MALCSDTDGNLPAFRISTKALELARELDPILNAIDTFGQGEGQITMKVQPNRHIPWIDWTFRKFRKTKNNKAS